MRFLLRKRVPTGHVIFALVFGVGSGIYIYQPIFEEQARKIAEGKSGNTSKESEATTNKESTVPDSKEPTVQDSK